MSNIINNIDLDKIRNTVENGRKNRQSLKKPVKLEREWNLFNLDKEYQFRTEISYEKGKEVTKIDSLYSGNYFMFYCYLCNCNIKSRN
jgi:hypothetical protein